MSKIFAAENTYPNILIQLHPILVGCRQPCEQKPILKEDPKGSLSIPAAFTASLITQEMALAE